MYTAGAAAAAAAAAAANGSPFDSSYSYRLWCLANVWSCNRKSAHYLYEFDYYIIILYFFLFFHPLVAYIMSYGNLLGNFIWVTKRFFEISKSCTYLVDDYGIYLVIILPYRRKTYIVRLTVYIHSCHRYYSTWD